MLTSGAAERECLEVPLRLVPNLRDWPFFPERPKSPGVSIVGSLELNRFVVLPSVRVPVVLRAVELLSREPSPEAVTAALRAEGVDLDVRKLYSKFSAAGLALDPSGRPTRRTIGVDVSMVHVWGTNLSSLAPMFRLLGRARYWLLGTSAALLLTCLTVIAMSHAAFLVMASGFSRGSGVSIPLAGLPLLILCFVFHEASHGVCAASLGLLPTRLETGFYFGFMPIFYLRIDGLYTLSPAKRIAVWSAGAFGNFVLGAAALLAAFVLPGKGGALLAHLAATSVLLGTFNLFPFIPTDGYFILSTLLRRHNVRKSAWQMLRDPRGWARSGRGQLSLILYGAAMVITFAVLFGSRLVRVVTVLASGQQGASFRALLFLVLPILFLWRASSRRKKQQTAETPSRDVLNESPSDT